MSHLQLALGKMELGFQAFRITTPLPTELQAAVEKVVGIANVKLDEQSTAQHQSRVAAIIKAGKIGQLSRRDLRMSCITITAAPFPPAAVPEIGEALLDEVRNKRRHAAFFALLETYLNTFDSTDKKTRWLADKLTSLAAQWPWRPNDLWRQRISRFELLDVDKAPKQLAREIIDDPERLSQILLEAGLQDGLRSQSKLVVAAFQSACAMVVGFAPVRAESAQKSLLVWNDNGRPDGRFPAAWLDICRACLEPWRAKSPSDAHKAYLVEALQKLGQGDPRTSNRQNMWGLVEDNAQEAFDVIIRWLTEVSVMQFLEIVDLSLTDPDARRMWAYRRAFWISYLQNKNGPKITKAWVAFGVEGALLAEEIARKSTNLSFRSFGRQYERTRQHSALIMQIGDLTIVDWSHSGKYNVWKRNQSGPKFFLKEYKVGMLDTAPLKESHVAPSHYSWQKRLGSLIEGRTIEYQKPEWKLRNV